MDLSRLRHILKPRENGEGPAPRKHQRERELGRTKRTAGRAAAAWLMLLIVCCGGGLALAEAPRVLEGQVKVAYLYNFAQYVEWPASAFASAGSPLIVTVLGTSGYPGAFEKLVEKNVRKRRLVVRQIASLEELGETHILFIGTSEKSQLTRILAALKSRPVLTVSDIKSFAGAGGTIGLVPQEGRLGFEINLKAARRADLKLSAHLLKLAVLVLE